MNTWIWACLGIAIGLLAPLAYRQLRRSEADATPAPPRPATSTPPVPAPRKTPSQRFHGITIQPCGEPCEAVLTLAKRRFLPEHAPQFPVPGCDRRQCQCAYRHHTDRRDEDDRRSGWGTFGGFAPSIPGGNRRGAARDRRARRQSGPAR